MSNKNVKIGDRIKVLETANDSITGKTNRGKILIVISSGDYYVLTNYKDCGGIWLDEFEVIHTKLDKVLE